MHFLLLLFLFMAEPVQALDWQQSFLFTAEQKKVATNQLNPSNRIWPQPTSFAQVESRSDVRWDLDPLLLVARPRAEGTAYKINGDPFYGEGSIFFQEVFAKVSVGEQLDLSAGRIQFGWGPAESITPSNWFAPELQYQASPNYEQIGVTRVQSAWSVGQDFSLILAQELIPLLDNTNTRNLIGETNAKRFLGKAEWSWDNSNEVLGFTAGRLRDSGRWRNRLGAYGSFTASDAWQLYTDGVMKEIGRLGVWKATVVPGIRYTFENGGELRFEGIYNGSGITRETREAAETILAARPAFLTQNLIESQAQSLIGRAYAYIGYRWSNASIFPADWQNPAFGFRFLRSLSDNSQANIGFVESGFYDRFTVSLYGSLVTGPNNTELHRLYDHLVGLSVKLSL